MPVGRYRIKYPILARFHEDEPRISGIVPTGAFITVDSAAFDGNKLVEVTWDGKKVMMLGQDLLSRSELVTDLE